MGISSAGKRNIERQTEYRSTETQVFSEAVARRCDFRGSLCRSQSRYFFFFFSPGISTETFVSRERQFSTFRPLFRRVLSRTDQGPGGALDAGQRRRASGREFPCNLFNSEIQRGKIHLLKSSGIAGRTDSSSRRDEFPANKNFVRELSLEIIFFVCRRKVKLLKNVSLF